MVRVSRHEAKYVCRDLCSVIISEAQNCRRKTNEHFLAENVGRVSRTFSLKKKCSRVSSFRHCKSRNGLYTELCRKSVSVYRALEKDGDQLERSDEETKGIMWSLGREEEPTYGQTGDVRINVTLRLIRATKVAVGKQ